MKMLVTFSQPLSLPWWRISPERHRRKNCVPWCNRNWTPSAQPASKWKALACYLKGPPSWPVISCAKFPVCVENVICWEHHRVPATENAWFLDGWLIFFCNRTVHFMWGFLRPWNSHLLLQFKQSFPWLEIMVRSSSCPIAFEFYRLPLVHLSSL